MWEGTHVLLWIHLKTRLGIFLSDWAIFLLFQVLLLLRMLEMKIPVNKMRQREDGWTLPDFVLDTLCTSQGVSVPVIGVKPWVDGTAGGILDSLEEGGKGCSRW